MNIKTQFSCVIIGFVLSLCSSMAFAQDCIKFKDAAVKAFALRNI